MIQGFWAVVLNSISIIAFSVLLIVFMLSILIKLKSFQLSNYSASSRLSTLWLVVLSPWVIGALTTALMIISDSQYITVPIAYDLLHWHHPEEFEAYSWHGVLILLALGYITALLIKNIAIFLSNRQKAILLHTLSEAGEDDVFKLEADAPAAFTIGYSQPRCYITTGLSERLSEQESDIVHLHEKEHARRFDPFKKWLFQLLTSFFPSSVASQLNRSMVLAVEQIADSAVSRVVKDKSLIAMTLLKVKRIINSPLRTNSGVSYLNDKTVCHYGLDNIEQRICYLLSEERAKKIPLFFLGLVVISMSVVCAVSADIFHHVIEYSL